MRFSGEIDIAEDNVTSYCYIPFSGLKFSKIVDMEQVLTAFNGKFLAGYVKRKYSETQIPFGCDEFSDEALFVSMLHEDYDVATRIYQAVDNLHEVYFRKVDLDNLGILPKDSEYPSLDTPLNQELNDSFRDAVKLWDVVLSIRKENPDIDAGAMKLKLIAATTGVSGTKFDRSYLNIKKLMKYATSEAGRGREQFIMAILSLYCENNSIPLLGDKRKLYKRLTCHDMSLTCQ